jgi:transcriptional regulator with XRE-family HTH domain
MKTKDAKKAQLLKTVAERVRRLRKRAGLTQPQLSAQAGIGPITLLRIEKGQQVLQVENLVGLSEALGVTPDCLLGYAEVPARAERAPGTQNAEPVAAVGS